MCFLGNVVTVEMVDEGYANTFQAITLLDKTHCEHKDCTHRLKELLLADHPLAAEAGSGIIPGVAGAGEPLCRDGSQRFTPNLIEHDEPIVVLSLY